jgi:hypothetical protein
MSPATIAALGALLTGIASCVTAILSNRSQRKKGVDECEKRLQEVRSAFEEGLRLKDAIRDDIEGERWSHLP